MELNNSKLPEWCMASECEDRECEECILNEDVEFIPADIDLENERNRLIR